MNHKSLKEILRRQDMLKIIPPFALCVISLILLIVNPFNQAYHPVSLDNPQSVTQLYESKTYYITYTAKDLYYSGLDYTVKGRPVASIYYFTSEDICYYVLLSVEYNNNYQATLHDVSFEARLINDNNTSDKLYASMSELLNYTEEGVHNLSCHILLSEYHYTHGIYKICLAGMHFVFLISVIWLLLSIVCLFNPTLSSSVMRLRHYGRARTLYTIAHAEFDMAHATGRNFYYRYIFYRYRKIYNTHNTIGKHSMGIQL